MVRVGPAAPFVLQLYLVFSHYIWNALKMTQRIASPFSKQISERGVKRGIINDLIDICITFL